MERPALMAWCCVVLSPARRRGQQAVQRRAHGSFRYRLRGGATYWLSEASAVILTDDLIALGAPAITQGDACGRSSGFAFPSPRR